MFQPIPEKLLVNAFGPPVRGYWRWICSTPAEEKTMPCPHSIHITYVRVYIYIHVCVCIYIYIWSIFFVSTQKMWLNYFEGYIWVKGALGLFLLLIHRHWWPDVCFVPMVEIVATTLRVPFEMNHLNAYLVAHPTARKWVITPVIYMGFL